MTKARGSAVLVGDLLVAAEIVSVVQLAQALPACQKSGLPVGRILVESGLLTNGVVRAAILAQSLIRDNLLPTTFAVKALKVVQQRDVSLDEALESLGWRSVYYERTNKLGDILVEAGCISEKHLTAAFEVCFASGLPLARVLVLRQVLPEVVAYAALTSQVLMRENRLTRQQAIEVVREAAARAGIAAGGNLTGQHIDPAGKIRLGELLVAAGLVSEIDLLSAVEVAIVEEKPIGQVLIGAHVINDNVLNVALEVQQRVNSRMITPEQALQILRQAPNQSAAPLQQPPGAVQTQHSLEEMELPELLRMVGLAHLTDVPKVVRELIIQKEHMAYKIVSQQEEIKTNLARDLHDTIVADLMMLRRYLAGDKQLTPAETIEIVDHVVRQLRDICYDFAPRQLHDLGLQASLGDLMERMQQRAGTQCQLIADGELPPMPEPVKLHIFRIMQEALNNIEKYAGASQATLTIDRPAQRQVRFVLADNGKGFEQSALGPRTDAGGMGIGSMKERAELIRCYFPARLQIESKPGAGSSLMLELTV